MTKWIARSLLTLTALSNPVHAEVTVVPEVDLTRYVGRWFEIASIPQWFQRKCVGDVSAEYTRLDDGLIKVVNQCRKADGTTSVAEGRARVADPAVPAKLEVTFVKLFGWIFAIGGDYWIVDLAADYHYAVIGHPQRKYAWILARTPTLPAAELKGIVERLTKQGYDVCELKTTSQGEPTRERRPLCEAL